ncbi:hypothetical protein B296_00035613 [Ensete ventricosum]|uniref:Uncharacterized protein n=1 Tax=Ensete ventricosum TaxID=4639 RepID=A0A426Y0T8_ENSVE|nr:hypothetical protein B296_00035613 [Ensete ventricosum]
MAAETLVAGKRDETKRPQVEQPRGHPPPPKRREDRPHLARPPASVCLRPILPPRWLTPPRLITRPKGLVEKQIDVIFGGPASGGNNSSTRKAYARFEVGKRPLHDEDLDVTFKSGGEEYPCHDDALVISIRMANAYVKRVMVDMGSSTDILYFDAFQKLGLTDRDLVTLTSTLTGFTGDFVSPMGATTIPVTFGGEPRSKTLVVSFMVVKLPSAYNAIIGHSTLNRLNAIVSTYHRILKFLTRAGVGEVRSDPRESRQRAVTKLYNRRVCHRYVKMGDLVLRKAEVNDPTRPRGKLAPNWEGPYRVVEVIRDETYTLATMEGRVLPRT